MLAYSQLLLFRWAGRNDSRLLQLSHYFDDGLIVPLLILSGLPPCDSIRLLRVLTKLLPEGCIRLSLVVKVDCVAYACSEESSCCDANDGGRLHCDEM